MAWRVATSLDVLLKQLNAMAPKRSKKSDGSIGDAAHASRDSDHNPWFSVSGVGIVTARDFTHDPAGGLDCNDLAKWLTLSGDSRIKYVIWNRRIWNAKAGWVAYKGSNPHDHHLHLSVTATAKAFDSMQPWALGTAAGSVGSPITATPTTPREGFLMALSSEQQDDLYRRVVKIDQWMDDASVDASTGQPRGFAQRIGVVHEWVTSSGNGIADRIGRLVTKLGA